MLLKTRFDTLLYNIVNTIKATYKLINLQLPANTNGAYYGNSTNAFNIGYSGGAIGDLVILDSNVTWQKTDANTLNIYSGMLGIITQAVASGSAVIAVLPNSIIHSSTFGTLTVGSPVYLSETAGSVTQTAPTTTDSATRIIGYAVHANKIYFNPSNDYITHV